MTADGAGVEVAGVALVVEQDQAACPVGVAFPRPLLAAARPRDLADEVEEARGLGGTVAGKDWLDKGCPLNPGQTHQNIACFPGFFR